MRMAAKTNRERKIILTQLTPDEQFLLQNHRDMVANKRYGEVISRYEAGKLVMAGKNEKLLPPGSNGNGNGKKG